MLRGTPHATLPVSPEPGQAQPSDSPKATLVTSATGRMLASPSGLAAGRSNQPTPLPPHSSSPPRATCHGHQDSSPAPPGTQSTHPAAAPTEAPDSGNSCSKAGCPLPQAISVRLCTLRSPIHPVVTSLSTQQPLVGLRKGIWVATAATHRSPSAKAGRTSLAQARRKGLGAVTPA